MCMAFWMDVSDGAMRDGTMVAEIFRIRVADHFGAYLTEEDKKEIPQGKKDDQKAVDAALIKAIEAVPELKTYLGARFSLKQGMKPHELRRQVVELEECLFSNTTRNYLEQRSHVGSCFQCNQNQWRRSHTPTRNSLAMQEFMILPVGATSFFEAFQMGSEGHSYFLSYVSR
ncbi:hypothetical protein Bca101_055845 [Brassica carinata]